MLNRKTLPALLGVVILFSPCSVRASAEYTVIQLYDELVTSFSDPQISDNGYVVWQGCDGGSGGDCYGGDWEIFVYDGTSTYQLTSNTHHDRDPRINDSGYVVWQGSDGEDNEIFLYDGMGITNVSNNHYWEYHPQINNDGYVVWWGGPAGPTPTEIYLYDGTSTTQLTNNAYNERYPQINDNGYVVWCGYEADYGFTEIFLYDGTSTTNISNTSGDDQWPQIGNNGYVTWRGSNGSGWQIFLYDGTSTIQLTDSYDFQQYPQINDRGDVVWDAITERSREVFLFNGLSTTIISDDNWVNCYPQINDEGYVVWYGFDDSEGHIFLYDGWTTTKITKNNYGTYRPQINNSGQVVWAGWNGSGWAIFLAIPCSLDNDNDDDGYVSSSCGGDDCDDSNPNIYPTNPNTYCNCEDPYPQGTDEICGDGEDNDCSGTVDDKDQDGDGYVDENCGGDDCNDNDPDTNPGATDGPADDVDEDCSGFVTCYVDADADGYGSATSAESTFTATGGVADIPGACGSSDTDNWDETSNDCDDLNPDVYPGAPERCDGIDNDCAIYPAVPSDESDDDGDGFVECTPWVDDPSNGGGDCDDASANIYPTNANDNCDCADPIPQGTPEGQSAGNCGDGVDNDCDGLVDTDPECGGGTCAGPSEASTYRASRVYGVSDLAEHLAYLFVPLGAVIGLSIRRRAR